VGLGAISMQCKSEEAAHLPDTPSGRLVGDWINACQAKDSARLTAWFTANLSDNAAKQVPAQFRAMQDLGLCEANGGFRLAGITKDEAGTISVLLVGLKSDVWFGQSLGANGAAQRDETNKTPQ